MLDDCWGYSYRNESPRIRAWYEHYIRKGCSTTKAMRVARDKVWRSTTWPKESH